VTDGDADGAIRLVSVGEQRRRNLKNGKWRTGSIDEFAALQVQKSRSHHVKRSAAMIDAFGEETNEGEK